MIADLSLSNKAEKSKIEEADIIEAISELNSKELTYQAALAASSKVMKLSLLDYL
jgi:flagellar hook-associated protein 3 FlgL